MKNRIKRTRKLTKRQLAVIEDILSGELTEAEVLKKHKVGLAVYRKWCSSEAFVKEMLRREAGFKRQSELLLARYAPLAAAKLVALTDSEKDETVRKACLDIISAAGEDCKAGAAGKDKDSLIEAADAGQGPAISPETASKLLEVLAGEEKAGIGPEWAVKE